jgi:hypothetical protein
MNGMSQQCSEAWVMALLRCTYTVMEIDIVFNESFCQDFVILLGRSLGDDLFDFRVAETLCTFNAYNARMTGVDVSNNVSVETLPTDSRVMVVVVAVEGRKGSNRLVFHANRTVAHVVSGGIGCGQGVLELGCFSLCRMQDEQVVVICILVHLEVCGRRKGYLRDARLPDWCVVKAVLCAIKHASDTPWHYNTSDMKLASGLVK